MYLTKIPVNKIVQIKTKYRHGICHFPQLFISDSSFLFHIHKLFHMIQMV